ncbi:hypothetical protein Tco_1352787 [Tanacetum coccineum]
MGRDTIQLEDAVSNHISRVSFEVASEYYISEKPTPRAGLVPEKMDLFKSYQSPKPPGKDRDPTNETAHEVPLLTAIASLVIQMVDAIELSTSSGTPSTMERSLLDISNKDAPPPVTQGGKSLAGYECRLRACHPCYAENIFSLFSGCRSSKEAGGAGNQDSENSTPSPSIYWVPRLSLTKTGWGVPNDCRLDTPEACQDVVDHIAP